MPIEDLWIEVGFNPVTEGYMVGISYLQNQKTGKGVQEWRSPAKDVSELGDVLATQLGTQVTLEQIPDLPLHVPRKVLSRVYQNLSGEEHQDLKTRLEHLYRVSK